MSRVVHGGAKFYHGAAGGARAYLEAGRGRCDDYYLVEGTGLATRYVVGTVREGGTHVPNAAASPDPTPADRVPGGDLTPRVAGSMDGDTYERWVAGYDVETGAAKGRLRTDAEALRFVEVVVNGPKTWSLAAALHPELGQAYDAAQERAAVEIIGWVAENSTTRVGPRGRQVQVPVEQLEAAVVRHHTSRAGDPHRHLHLQINARVFAAGGWRGLHSVGTVHSLAAINGIGHAAIACDPQFRQTLTDLGYTLDPATGEVAQLAPFAGAFSARAAQIGRNVDRYEAAWRADHPGQEPWPALERSWDRRAWADARPDKVVPADGEAMRRRWVEELTDLGFTPPNPKPNPAPTPRRRGRGRGHRSRRGYNETGPSRRPTRSGRAIRARRPGRAGRAVGVAIGSCIATTLPTWRWCGSVQRGRRGTPPTSAVRWNGSSSRPVSSRRGRYVVSSPRTSSTARSPGACGCWTATTSRDTSGR